MPKKYDANLLEDVVSSIRSSAKPDVVPSGWYTMKQMAKRNERSVSRTERIVEEACIDGHLERKTFRILTTGGRLYPVPHYRKKVLK